MESEIKEIMSKINPMCAENEVAQDELIKRISDLPEKYKIPLLEFWREGRVPAFSAKGYSVMGLCTQKCTVPEAVLIIAELDGSDNNTVNMSKAEKFKTDAEIFTSVDAPEKISESAENPEIKAHCSIFQESRKYEDLLRKIIKEELSSEFSASREQFNVQMANMLELLTDSADKDTQLTKKEELFQQVYDELQKHQRGFEQSVILPFLKMAFKWYERILQMSNFYKDKKSSQDAIEETYDNLLREFENLGFLILDTLENYNIEIIPSKHGEIFDPKLHCAVETTPISDVAMDKSINQCFTPGFRYIDGKIIQYAKVSVFKYVEGEK